MIPVYTEEKELVSKLSDLTVAVSFRNYECKLDCLELKCQSYAGKLLLRSDCYKEAEEGLFELIKVRLQEIKDYLQVFSLLSSQDEVLDFLLRNRHYIEHFKRIVPNIRKYFPSEELWLGYDNWDNEHLCINIMTKDCKVGFLHDFDHEYWFNYDDKDIDLVIDVGFL